MEDKEKYNKELIVAVKGWIEITQRNGWTLGEFMQDSVSLVNSETAPDGEIDSWIAANSEEAAMMWLESSKIYQNKLKEHFKAGFERGTQEK